ncbi:hypothetical protein CFP65_0488 [Kitasatospora sp. MMS16-BH015]|uniref:effector-associated constant component EACC1 n=1 Tax=Kitasatospora sp. MMS16-BH015 TaxID=2018025 RepID=UPI000CA0A521|nr:hypothetical protein [Kitasatospora sp. MMS16-BH015]AUG75451.1 hypothetical protein CFP65_0488 [Kitasatospora sp. MMS16-BH015]
MQARLSIRVDGGCGDDLRSLRQWLTEEEALRGRLELERVRPAPGTLGTVTETLTVLLGPGGVATAVASVLISWIRRRRGTVTLKVTRPDGTATELSATHVGGLDAAQVRQLSLDLSDSFTRDDDA